MEASTRSTKNHSINSFLKLSQNKRYFYIDKYKNNKRRENRYEQNNKNS